MSDQGRLGRAEALLRRTVDGLPDVGCELCGTVVGFRECRMFRAEDVTAFGAGPGWFFLCGECHEATFLAVFRRLAVELGLLEFAEETLSGLALWAGDHGVRERAARTLGELYEAKRAGVLDGGRS